MLGFNVSAVLRGFGVNRKTLDKRKHDYVLKS